MPDEPPEGEGSGGQVGRDAWGESFNLLSEDVFFHGCRR